MQPIAIIQATTIELDSAIVWEDAERLVAFAYQDGQVKRSRPLDADTVQGAIAETQTAFGIGEAQVTTVRDWQLGSRIVAPVSTSGRWEINR